MSAKLKNFFSLHDPWGLMIPSAPIFMGTMMAWGDGIQHWPTAVISWLASLCFFLGLQIPSDKRRVKSDLILLGGVCASYPCARGGEGITLLLISFLLFSFFIVNQRIRIFAPGLKEFLILLCAGPLPLAATYYCQSLEINLAVLCAGLAPGLFTLSRYFVEQIYNRRESDIFPHLPQAVKSVKNALLTFYFLCLTGVGLIPVLVFLIARDHPLSLYASFTVLWLVPHIIPVFIQEEIDYFKNAKRRTMKILCLYCLIFCWGWVL